MSYFEKRFPDVKPLDIEGGQNANCAEWLLTITTKVKWQPLICTFATTITVTALLSSCAFLMSSVILLYASVSHTRMIRPQVI